MIGAVRITEEHLVRSTLKERPTAQTDVQPRQRLVKPVARAVLTIVRRASRLPCALQRNLSPERSAFLLLPAAVLEPVRRTCSPQAALSPRLRRDKEGLSAAPAPEAASDKPSSARSTHGLTDTHKDKLGKRLFAALLKKIFHLRNALRQRGPAIAGRTKHLEWFR
jgi:hypothetical protein